MDRRRRSSIAGSPLLIGAITTLIVLVAVFLSYNANNGLPFVPTYNIKVELPETNGLQPANQVRIAGTRVGIVGSIKAHQNPNTGAVRAIAELKLEKKLEPLPANTKAIVQSVSAIGLKYLELEKGNSIQKLHAGGTIPVSQTTEPVNIEDLFNMFDKPTRTAIKINTNNFGNGVAGRGLGLNKTISELRPLVTNAVPVLHNLASPQTDLRGFFIGLDKASSEVAPVAQQQANYFVDLDTFFTAWAGVASSIEAATRGGPAALEQAIHSLPAQATFTENAAEFMHLLRPSAEQLKVLAPELGHAFSVGAVNLRAATALNQELASSAKALSEFGSNPVVLASFEDLTHTLEVGNPLLAGITPAQAACNYFTLAFRNVASLQSESLGVGTIARAGVVLAPVGENNEGYPSNGIANGPSYEKQVGAPKAEDTMKNHLHANPYPRTSAPGQPSNICEAGNETYVIGRPITTNLPLNLVAKNREFTSRSQNLYGETYPASTLSALGIKTGKKK
jgi:ABC-type transporter Mla subunit MlaD